MKPAWIPCRDCDEFWCLLHGMHAHECPCPPIDDWTVDPYTTRPTPPRRERPKGLVVRRRRGTMTPG